MALKVISSRSSLLHHHRAHAAGNAGAGKHKTALPMDSLVRRRVGRRCILASPYIAEK